MQGLGNDIANQYGPAQTLLSGNQGLGNASLAYNQLNNLGARQYPQVSFYALSFGCEALPS